MSETSEAWRATITSVRLDKLEQKLFWYDNVPDDETIVRYVHKMREYQRELRELGEERKSAERRIAEAVAAEREAIATICLEAGNTALANKCGEIAGALFVTVAKIRAREEEP